jgi:hypothetical protein
MTDSTTHWACTQHLGPYPTLEPIRADEPVRTVRFAVDTARQFARDTERLAVYQLGDTPILRERDGVFTIVCGGAEIGVRHVRRDGTVTLGRPWCWQGYAVDDHGNLTRTYVLSLAIDQPYSVPDAADALYPIVVAGSAVASRFAWEPHLDYELNDGHFAEALVACSYPLGPKLQCCLRRPGHLGAHAQTTDTGQESAEPNHQP